MIIQSFVILALLSILGRCAIVSQQLSSTNFLPGLRFRVYHPKLEQTTLSYVKDYMKTKQYETDGELIGETNGVQDLLLRWVRYKSNTLNGIYVDPTIDAITVEYRGYIKLTQTKYKMLLGSNVYLDQACNGENTRQFIFNYMEIDTNLWVDNNSTGSYCVMNNTKSKYVDLSTAAGSVETSNVLAATSGSVIDQINQDVYYPVRFVATFLRDGARQVIDYTRWGDANHSKYGSNELFYDPNENYNDLDSGQRLPFPQNCPVFDSTPEENLNTYTPPETTLPDVCPATSSSTSIATPEVSTSQTSSSVATSSSSEVPSTSEIVSLSTIDSTSELSSSVISSSTISSSEISSSVLSSSVVSSSVVSSSVISSSVVSSSTISSSDIFSSAISSSEVSSSTISSSVISSSTMSSFAVSSSAVSSSAVSSSAISSSAVASSSEPSSALVASSFSEQLSTSEIISSSESTPSSESVPSVTNIETSDASSISETISTSSAVFTSEEVRPVVSSVHSSAELMSSKSNSLSSNDVNSVSSQALSSLEITTSSSSEYIHISSATSIVDSSTPSVSKTSETGVSERSSSIVVSSSGVQDLSSTTTNVDQGSTDAANTRSASSTESRLTSSNTGISLTSEWNTQYSNQSGVILPTNSIISDNALSETLRSTIIHHATVTQTEKCAATHICNTDKNHPDTPNTSEDTTKTNRVTRSTTQPLDALTSAEVTTKSGPKTGNLEPNNSEQAPNHRTTTTTTSFGVKSTAVNARPNDAGVSSVAQFHWSSEVEQSVSGLASPASSSQSTSTHIISQFADQAVSGTISTSLLVVFLLANFM
ncbi:hypothetical protein DAKH74_023630 [Maudiozyma humilis]|uniref:Uncharacterized protein n=1 Tax=Maudiozyma humilis TaxID=51915 RepID=A0AAV5RYC4_MAUHU|nr:hypothetical protein DAKH74_023630 [Kazachstania humilis]